MEYPDLPGRYLRKKREGMRDPTMTHVDDPYAFQVGDYVRDDEGWFVIVEIKEKGADTRFAYLSRSTRHRPDLDDLLPGPHLHDLRSCDAENFHAYAWLVTDNGYRPVSEVMTVEEAGRAYQEALQRAKCR